MSLLPPPLFSLPDDTTPLFSAVARHDLTEVQELLKNTENMNQMDQVVHVRRENIERDRSDYVSYNYNRDCLGGWTPLLWACKSDLVDIAFTLINKGADIHHKLGGEQENSCLLLACLNESTQLAQQLIDKGANINHKNNEEDFPLYVACENGYTQIVELLVKNGANVHETNKFRELQNTPILIASTEGHVEVVKMLIENGANVNEQTPKKLTPLMIASSKGYTQIVKLLLENGANVNTEPSK